MSMRRAFDPDHLFTTTRPDLCGPVWRRETLFLREWWRRKIKAICGTLGIRTDPGLTKILLRLLFLGVLFGPCCQNVSQSASLLNLPSDQPLHLVEPTSKCSRTRKGLRQARPRPGTCTLGYSCPPRAQRNNTRGDESASSGSRQE